MVTVKKYGNRRLYDTSRSSYINLEQLAELIRGGQEVCVVDAKTGEDLTREVLLQVVMEVLQGGGILSVSMLRRMIRATGNDPWSRMINQQLITGLQLLSTQLDQAERMFGMGGLGGTAAPFGMGASVPNPAPPSPTPPPEEPQPPDPEPPRDEARQELEELRARLADIEKLLKR